MQFTTQRKSLLGVFGLSLIGLGTDYFILGHEAGPAPHPAAAVAADARPTAPAPPDATDRPAPEPAAQRRGVSVARQLALLPDSPGGSAFEMPVAWRQEIDSATPKPVAAPPPVEVAHDLSARLTSIVKGPDGWRAIVNGRTVRLGDAVGGWRAVEMAPRSVVFALGERRVTLALSE